MVMLFKAEELCDASGSLGLFRLAISNVLGDLWAKMKYGPSCLGIKFAIL